MSGQSKEYREYMKSDSWERKKRERLKIDGYKCTACGYSAKPNVLMVHHLTYARLGNEDIWKDLTTLSLEESLPMTSTQEALRAEDLPKLGAEE